MLGVTSHYDAYVASLPDGLDSYPDCVVKGSVVRVFGDRLEPEVLDNLPAEVRELSRNPPQMNEWVPFAKVAGLAHGVRDQVFIGDDDGLRVWFAGGMESVLSSPMYRILLSLTSPVRIARTSERRWSAFNRGVTRKCLAVFENGARGEVRYPPYLIDELLAEAFVQSFERALALSRARNPVVQLVEWTPEYFISEGLFDQVKPRGAQLE